MYVYNLYLYSSLHSEQECDVYSKYNDVKKKKENEVRRVFEVGFYRSRVG